MIVDNVISWIILSVMALTGYSIKVTVVVALLYVITENVISWAILSVLVSCRLLNKNNCSCRCLMWSWIMLLVG